jgi:WD40 repeat protein
VENLFTGEHFSWEAHDADITSLVFASATGHLLTSSFDGFVKIWKLPEHKLLKQFDSKSALNSMDVSADESAIATGDSRGTITLWHTSDEHRPVWSKTGHSGLVMSVAIDPKSQFVATGGVDGLVIFWSLDGAELSRKHAHTQAVNSVFFGPAANIFTASSDQTIRMWSRDTFNEQGDPWNEPTFAAQFSARDGALAIVDSTDSILLKDVSSRATLKDMHSPSNFISSVAFSVDGNVLATGSYDTRVRLWGLNSDAGPTQSSQHRGSVTSLAFSPNGEYFATGGIDKKIVVTNQRTGEVVDLPNDKRVTSIAFDPKSKTLIAGDEPEPEDSVRIGTVKVWPLEGRPDPIVLGTVPGGVKSVSIDYTGTKVAAGSGGYSPAQMWNLAQRTAIAFPESVNEIVFSPKDALFVTTSEEGVSLWQEGEKTAKWKVAGKYSVVAFSPDGRYVAASQGADVTLRDVHTGHLVESLVGHSDLVTSIAFNEGRKLVATGSWDGTTRLWHLFAGGDRQQESSSWICTLVSYAPELWFINDTPWVVVEPGGHFDTNSPDEMPGLHWIVKNRPYDPLPIESFERVFYQPRLLRALLDNKPLRSTDTIANLNYDPPSVKIRSVLAHDGEPDLVDVTVDVTAIAAGSKDKADIGVYDLKLFVDGQLVAYKPNVDEQASKLCDADRLSLKRWRCATLVSSSTATTSITFPPIRISPAKYFRDIEMSAYAFNEDKVKSVTDRCRYHVTEGKHTEPYEPRAYLINIGISKTKNARWNLVMPGPDARWMSSELAKVLVGTKYYKDVVPIIFASDNAFDSSTEIPPSKANIQAVFDLLAGKSISPEANSQIPAQLRRRMHTATVDDIVIISFAGHGRTNESGDFFLFPYDVEFVPRTARSGSRCINCISTLELSDWLKDIYSGNMVLILDACRSAGSVETEDFRLGPMGDPGLGQLAYDKDIQILAASQVFQDARGIAELGHSALAYALIKEGLIDKKAADSSGGLELATLLTFGVDEVPRLYSKYLSGEKQTQEPKLFDFTAKGPGIRRDPLPAIVLFEPTFNFKEQNELPIPAPPPDPGTIIEPIRSWNLEIDTSSKENRWCLPQLSRNNLVVAVACDDSPSVWILDIPTGGLTEIKGVLDEPQFGFRDIRLSPTGAFLVASNGIAHPVLAVWDIRANHRHLIPLPNVPEGMEFIQGGQKLVILPHSSDQIAVYDFSKHKFLQDLSSLKGPALLSDEWLCSQKAYNKARVSNLEFGSSTDLDDARECVQFSNDASVIATLGFSDWAMSQLWLTKNGTKLAKHKLDTTSSASDKALIILPDNQRAIVRSDANQILLWDFVKDTFSNSLLNLGRSKPDMIAASRSGKTVAINTAPGFRSGELVFLDIQADKVLAHVELDSSLWGYSASPDHKVLAVSRNRKPAVMLWDLEDGSPFGVCKDSSRDYTFSSDSTLLVTTRDNGEVRVFRVPTENDKKHEP